MKKVFYGSIDLPAYMFLRPMSDMTGWIENNYERFSKPGTNLSYYHDLFEFRGEAEGIDLFATKHVAVGIGSDTVWTDDVEYEHICPLSCPVWEQLWHLYDREWTEHLYKVNNHEQWLNWYYTTYSDELRKRKE